MASQPDYSLRYPPVIEFGWGCRARLPDVVRGLGLGPAPRVFVVCARTLVRTGQADELGRLCGGNVCGVSTDVPHDPPLETVDRLAQALRETGAEAVLSAGGGSVMDAAKAAAILLPGTGSVRDCFATGRAPDRRGLPHLALPTTAGTGAEITRNAVRTDAQ